MKNYNYPTKKGIDEMIADGPLRIRRKLNSAQIMDEFPTLLKEDAILKADRRFAQKRARNRGRCFVGLSGEAIRSVLVPGCRLVP
jgi:hypothetical protein